MAPKTKKSGEGKRLEPAAREATIHLHKLLHGISYKNRAPRCVQEERKRAQPQPPLSRSRLNLAPPAPAPPVLPPCSAVREIKAFAAKMMSTKDVRISADLNKVRGMQARLLSLLSARLPTRSQPPPPPPIAPCAQAVWQKGIRHVPVRLRLTLTRQRNEDEDAKEKMYTLVEHVAGNDLKEKLTEKLDIADA